MNSKRHDEEQVPLKFSDLLLILKQAKPSIRFWTLGLAILAIVFVLMRKPQYSAEATFREKAKSATSEVNKTLSLSMLAGSNDSNENAAVSLMKSRKLAEKVVQRRNLQAALRKDVFGWLLLHNIRNNIKAEWAYIRDRQAPSVSEPEELIQVSSIHYTGEVPLNYRLKFISEDAFMVLEKGGQKLAEGTLNTVIQTTHGSFIITRASEGPLSNTIYKLVIQPLHVAAKRLNKCLSCETDSRDKTLLKIAFKHDNRHEAGIYLNALMALYQEQLRADHQQIVAEQLVYLQKRKDETAAESKRMMKEHAHALSSNTASIDFLSQMQQSYTQKLLLLDMELRRLQKAREEGIAFYDHYWFDGNDPTIINQLLDEIRGYRQQADSIDIALRKMGQEDPESFKQSFEMEIAELERVKSCAEEVKTLLIALQNKNSLPSHVKIIQNPKYKIGDWQVKLKSYQIAAESASPQQFQEAKDNLDACRINYTVYLSNLIHVLEVEEKIIQERLTHQQCPQIEFQGIDLATASQMYINYSKSLNDIEAQILHYEFILDQMTDPNFEPSSLSTVLDDPVSKEIISRSGNLALLAKDEENRSQRELDRMKAEISQQKGFLALHLSQTMQLFHLRKKLCEEKILSIQNVQLELIHQKISVLEQHLADYIDSRISNIKQEKEAIDYQQLVLQKEMAKMPEKWASQKLIDHHLEMNTRWMEEITKIVETKNISSNLDISQSSPMDKAIVPIHPVRPHIILFALLGGLVGFLGSAAYAFSRAVVQGIPASAENLKLSKQLVAGTLSKSYTIGEDEALADQDLNTLRRLSTQLCSPLNERNEAQILLLMIGQGYDYSPILGSLFGKSGFKVLLMPINFDAAPVKEYLPGLLQYLEGQADTPYIIKKAFYDEISAGGITRYSNELVGSARFHALLDMLKKKYDKILVISKANIASGEGENLGNQFDRIAITITNEKLQNLKPYIARSERGESHLSFIFGLS